MLFPRLSPRRLGERAVFTLEFAFIYLDAQDPNSSDFCETLSINTAHGQNHDNITINIIVTSPLTLAPD